MKSPPALTSAVRSTFRITIDCIEDFARGLRPTEMIPSLTLEPKFLNATTIEPTATIAARRYLKKVDTLRADNDFDADEGTSGCDNAGCAGAGYGPILSNTGILPLTADLCPATDVVADEGNAVSAIPTIKAFVLLANCPFPAMDEVVMKSPGRMAPPSVVTFTSASPDVTIGTLAPVERMIITGLDTTTPKSVLSPATSERCSA